MASLLSFFLFTAGVVLALLLLFRLLAPRRTAARQPALEFAITFDSAGFALADLRLNPIPDVQFHWLEINRIVAYKRDLFTYDCICMFVAQADGAGVELNEEMDGWKPFCEVLPEVLPGCESFGDWFGRVAFPAFATNPTELYARAGGDDDRTDLRLMPG